MTNGLKIQAKSVVNVHTTIDSDSETMNTKKVLIIIPAYNEEKSLPRLLAELKRLPQPLDLLVINDGSRDRTAEAALAAGAWVVNLPCNLGIGGAMQTGFKYAWREGYDIAAQVDGDGQHNPEDLLKVLEPLLRGDLDLAIGSRFISTQDGFRSTFTRRIGIQFFSALLRFLTGLPVTDPTSGFRAVARPLIARFAEYYPVDFPEPEAIMMAHRYGARIGEVPVTMRTRLGGISSIRYWKTVYYMLKVTLAILIDRLKKKG